jgi:hypothetical protein
MIGMIRGKFEKMDFFSGIDTKVSYDVTLISIALRASDVEFMFVRLYNLFLNFQQKTIAH